MKTVWTFIQACFTTIGGALGWFIGGAKKILDNKQELNDMNVFPIPDGDTGTNMDKTMGGILQGLVSFGSLRNSFTSLSRFSIYITQPFCERHRWGYETR